MNESIEIRNLSKYYGKKQALDRISLTIPKGMFGLLGRNGAGKTTLMRIMAATLDKTEGEISVCGIPIGQKQEIRRITGYLPQDFAFYPELTVYEALDYLGVLSEIPAALRKERIAAVLKTVNLNGKKNAKFKSLSGGMKRRLGIAQALLHQPKILIVDEPTVGLDPEERVRFREMLCEQAEERIVILSTHIVEDIEKTCERIAVLRDGRIFFHGNISEFSAGEKSLEEAYMKQIGRDL